MNKKNIEDITEEELLEIYEMVFTKEHSNSFKVAEIKMMLTSPNYIFLYKPIDGFLEKVEEYISDKGYELPEDFLRNYKKIKYGNH